MQKSQEPFYTFIMDRVQPDREKAANALLLESFRRQDEGVFSQEDLQRFHREIVCILKAEHKDEVTAVLNRFGESHVNGG